MTQSKHGEERVVIRGQVDVGDEEVEEGEREPAEEEDGDHADQQPAGPPHPLHVRPPLVRHLHGAEGLQPLPQLAVDQSVGHGDLQHVDSKYLHNTIIRNTILRSGNAKE